MYVGSYMRCHVFTLNDSASVEEAVRAFDLHQQPVVPVVDSDERFVGTVTAPVLGACLGRRAPATLKVLMPATLAEAALIERASPTCSPEDDLSYAAGLLLASHQPAVVVLETQRVVGLVGWPEICSWLVDDSLRAVDSNGAN